MAESLLARVDAMLVDLDESEMLGMNLLKKVREAAGDAKRAFGKTLLPPVDKLAFDPGMNEKSLAYALGVSKYILQRIEDMDYREGPRLSKDAVDAETASTITDKGIALLFARIQYMKDILDTLFRRGEIEVINTAFAKTSNPITYDMMRFDPAFFNTPHWKEIFTIFALSMVNYKSFPRSPGAFDWRRPQTIDKNLPLSTASAHLELWKAFWTLKPIPSFGSFMLLYYRKCVLYPLHIEPANDPTYNELEQYLQQHP